MLAVRVDPSIINRLQVVFGSRIRDNVPLQRYTSARIGGPADWFMEVQSADELAEAIRLIWQIEIPYLVLGGGSNILVSDEGFRGVVILNRARQVRFDLRNEPPVVWAESGANFGLIARQAGQQGLAGLEWAAGIPGSVGGAIAGNAGAHDGDIARNLRLADILHRLGYEPNPTPKREQWLPGNLEFSYRSSILKRNPDRIVVLKAALELKASTPEDVLKKMDQFVAYRHQTQPPGASLGSMFKNPRGDFAGHLIEAAGLKGTRVGDAEISSLHGNFFVNRGQASASDTLALIQHVQQRVYEKFGILLELEIELVGDWDRSLNRTDFVN